MALSKDDIAEIVKLYEGGNGETLLALATAYSVSKTTVRNHLDTAGVLLRPGSPVGDADEDLGIGEDDEPDEVEGPDALAVLMADPRMAALLDAAVAQRLAQMGAPVSSAAVTGLDAGAFDNLAKTLGRMIEVNAMQQPGYIKPLPVAEVEARLAGKVEMEALLREYERAGTAPLWLVGPGGFFECANAQEFLPNQQIRTYLPPPEDFVPQNDQARKVHAAMMQWIGGPSPDIGEQVEAAMKASKEVPLVSGAPQAAKSGLVEVVASAPVADTRRRRSAGTIVHERHDISLADRAAGAVGPQGPSFGETAAA